MIFKCPGAYPNVTELSITKNMTWFWQRHSLSNRICNNNFNITFPIHVFIPFLRQSHPFPLVLLHILNVLDLVFLILHAHDLLVLLL